MLSSTLITILLSFRLLSSAHEPDSAGFIVRNGYMIPFFEMTLTDGTKVTTESFKGKVVMLQFTASWCGVCRREMPYIEKDIWQRFQDDAFLLYGIARDEPAEKAIALSQATGITYPLGLDPGAHIFSLFALKNSGVTRNIIIGKDGKIIHKTRLFNEKEFYEMVEVIKKHLENK